MRVALLENEELVELYQESSNSNFSVGDFYLGRVKRLKPSLNAAFVDIGHEKDAFLHYHDLSPQFASIQSFVKYKLRRPAREDPMLEKAKYLPDIDKHGKIGDVLKKGQLILVKVEKEPISTKGPRLSCELSIPGRNIVLVPFSNEISISKKIRLGKERKRLRVLLSSIKPANFGIVVRTAAEGATVADLDRELRRLTEKWSNCIRALSGANGPTRCLREMDRSKTLLRDLLNDNFAEAVTNDEDLFGEMKEYVAHIAKGQEKIAKLHKGKNTVFSAYGIERQIKRSFGQTVNMTGGSYLVIEHTEALHVIDVNSGSRPTKDEDREESILKVNLDAAKEVARQLRLRDMGGIIVIDFIDMRKTANRREVYNKMREFMKPDRAKHTVLTISRFGLMQITRQRVRPEVNISTSEKCPTCQGTGKIQASILVTDDIEAGVRFILKDQNQAKLTIRAHPYVAAYLTKGVNSVQRKWFFTYFKRVKVIPDESYHIGEYRFFNGADEPIAIPAQ